MHTCVETGEIVEWSVIIMKGAINRVRNRSFTLSKVSMRLPAELDM